MECALLSLQRYLWNWSAWDLLSGLINDSEEVGPLPSVILTLLIVPDSYFLYSHSYPYPRRTRLSISFKYAPSTRSTNLLKMSLAFVTDSLVRIIFLKAYGL